MRLFSILLLLTSLFGLSSCINIEEEIWIEADGSGRSAYTLDLSEMYDLLIEKAEEERNSADYSKDILAEVFRPVELDTIKE